MDNEFGFDAYDDYDVDELIDGMGSGAALRPISFGTHSGNLVSKSLRTIPNAPQAAHGGH